LAGWGILHQTTLPYSPYMNAKIETLWGLVEGRLLAMLEDVPDLALPFLNEATQAWAEFEYNRKVHSEIGETPIARETLALTKMDWNNDGPYDRLPLPCRDRRDAAEPGQCDAQARLHQGRPSHPAQERRHHRGRRRPLRGAELRGLCRVRTASLYERLAALTAAGRLAKSDQGYRLIAP
jgi:hypothetical protein